MSKYDIQGTVLCKCGGTLVGRDGKVQLTEDFGIICWKCSSDYDPERVLSIRKEDKTVIFYERFGSINDRMDENETL